MRTLRRKPTPEDVRRILEYVGDFEIVTDERTGIRCITGTSNHTATVIYHAWTPLVGQIEHARVYARRARKQGHVPTVGDVERDFHLVARFLSPNETEAFILGGKKPQARVDEMPPETLAPGEVAATVLAGLTGMTKQAVRAAGRNDQRAITSLTDSRIRKRDGKRKS